MAFANNGRFEKFKNKVWLSSPTMYPESMRYVMEAYKTNWILQLVKILRKWRK